MSNNKSDVQEGRAGINRVYTPYLHYLPASPYLVSRKLSVTEGEELYSAMAPGRKGLLKRPGEEALLSDQCGGDGAPSGP